MTRVLLMSDLHIDTNANIMQIKKQKVKQSFIDYVVSVQDKFDILFIVGDISDNMMYSLTLLRDLQNEIPNKVIKFVPGNHDIGIISSFSYMNPLSSDAAYAIYQHSKFSLDEPIILNDTVFVGGLGWYDYGFVQDYLKDVENTNEFLLDYKKKNWRDGKHVNFKLNDIELAKMENKRYRSLFEQYRKKDIFLLNHFVPFQRYITWNKSDEKWNYANAYMGSSKLEEMIEEFKNIKYVAFGHTHQRLGVNVIGERKEICSPLGYVGEWEDYDYETEDETVKLQYFIKECQRTSVLIDV